MNSINHKGPQLVTIITWYGICEKSIWNVLASAGPVVRSIRRAHWINGRFERSPLGRGINPPIGRHSVHSSPSHGTLATGALLRPPVYGTFTSNVHANWFPSRLMFSQYFSEITKSNTLISRRLIKIINNSYSIHYRDLKHLVCCLFWITPYTSYPAFGISKETKWLKHSLYSFFFFYEKANFSKDVIDMIG